MAKSKMSDIEIRADIFKQESELKNQIEFLKSLPMEVVHSSGEILGVIKDNSDPSYSNYGIFKVLPKNSKVLYLGWNRLEDAFENTGRIGLQRKIEGKTKELYWLYSKRPKT